MGRVSKALDITLSKERSEAEEIRSRMPTAIQRKTQRNQRMDEIFLEETNIDANFNRRWGVAPRYIDSHDQWLFLTPLRVELLELGRRLVVFRIGLTKLLVRLEIDPRAVSRKRRDERRKNTLKPVGLRPRDTRQRHGGRLSRERPECKVVTPKSRA